MGKRNNIWLVGGILLVVVIINVVIGSSPGKDSIGAGEEEEQVKTPIRWTSPFVPLESNFAGEPAPLDDPEVLERIDRELIVNTYRHSATIRYMKLAARWFPVIEPILAKNNIPDDFKFLCVAESGLDEVVSPAGAAGFWQFMPGTARNYGLIVNGEIDERYHVEMATEAACSYLKEAHAQFGNWTLAAASYNMGRGGLSNRLKSQGVNNYYDLHLNNETSRYVPRILALKSVMNHPQNYGFYIKEREKYERIVYRNVEVNKSIPNLSTYAKSVGTNYKTLRYLNPWIRSSRITVSSGKRFLLKVPM